MLSKHADDDLTWWKYFLFFEISWFSNFFRKKKFELNFPRFWWSSKIRGGIQIFFKRELRMSAERHVRWKKSCSQSFCHTLSCCLPPSFFPLKFFLYFRTFLIWSRVSKISHEVHYSCCTGTMITSPTAQNCMSRLKWTKLWVGGSGCSFLHRFAESRMGFWRLLLQKKWGLIRGGEWSRRQYAHVSQQMEGNMCHRPVLTWIWPSMLRECYGRCWGKLLTVEMRFGEATRPKRCKLSWESWIVSMRTKSSSRNSTKATRSVVRRRLQVAVTLLSH